MTIVIKPKILISKCIEHSACRYDGTVISSDFVKRLKDYVTIITVCPEVEIGLSIPREAVRIVLNDGKKELLSSLSGNNYTKEMEDFSESYLSQIQNNNIHGAILKNRSPSCGINSVKMYPSIGKVSCLNMKTSGIFGGAVLDLYPQLPIEDEGRLLNYSIRDHFLTRIFTFARFDEMKVKLSMAQLVKFHSEHKYLLMAYDQLKQKELGRIVANHDDLELKPLLDKYLKILQLALIKPLKKGKNTNMIQHIFGYVSGEISKEERVFFLEQLELYNQHKKPLSAVMTILYGFVVRFDQTYLKDQKIFMPYPIEILDVLDSGKGMS